MNFHASPLSRSPLSGTLFFLNILPGTKQSEFTSSSSKKSHLRTTKFSTKLGNCSFYVFVLQRTAERKPTRLYFARAVSLFRSLTLLFGGILHDVAVVVFLNSLTSRIMLPKVVYYVTFAGSVSSVNTVLIYLLKK